MHVLLIEDHPKMAAAIEKGLREHGLEVDVCRLGSEGEQQAAARPYDLILLDLMLPDRDGVDVCRSLRRRKIATPIFMLTALPELESKIDCLEAGATDYIGKPFDFDDLIDRIRKIKGRDGVRDASAMRDAGDEGTR